MPRVMRVLTRPNVGGPARQAVALWHALSARGWQTLLVVGVCEGEPAVDLRAAGIPAVGLDAVGKDSAGFVVVPTLRRGVHPVRDMLARWRLGKLMAAFAPEVVHTHTSKAGALARPEARAAGVPVVAHTFHGHVLQDYFPRGVGLVVRLVERWLARRTDLLFAVSPSCRDELVALRIAPAGRIAVLPPAVDVSVFVTGAGGRARARARLGLTEGQLVLGFVGRLVPIKRPRMFADVVARLPDAMGLVFGDGPLRGSFEGVPRLRLLGAVRDLPELLPACDALVLTSVREGCPLAAVEAFAAGVPVVGLDVPGVRDVLGGWGSGVLVREEDGVEGLVAACAGLRDPARRAELAEAARSAVGRFAPDAVAGQLVAAYESEVAAAAARQAKLHAGQREKPSWVDVLLVVPLFLGSLTTCMSPFVCYTGETAYHLQQDAQAVLSGAVVVMVAWWRGTVVRHRRFRGLMREIVFVTLVGLVLLVAAMLDLLV